MNYLLSAPEEKLNKEAFGELPGPRGIIVSSLWGSTNQRFAVICAIGECSHSELAREMGAEPTVNGQTCLYVGKGDFPFPFQAPDQNNESEVKSQLQAIDFYCKKCRKSKRIPYALTGDRMAPAMNGIMIKCHTHKFTRVVTIKNFTEGQIVERTDALGKR